jgi:phosphoglycolate phosphatase
LKDPEIMKDVVAVAQPEAVIFDLDGTLIDSARDIARALNLSMERRGLAQFPLPHVKEMIGGGVVRLLERALAAQGADTGAAAAVAMEFMEIYGASATAETTLYPGAVEQLEALAEAGVKVGLCTNKPHGLTEQILRELGLNGYFGSVLGGKDENPRKPRPEPLLLVVAELGAAPSRSLMVGDSAPDVGAARAAGVPVAVLSHGYSKTPVHELGADVVIDTLWELPRAIAAIGFDGKRR